MRKWLNSFRNVLELDARLKTLRPAAAAPDDLHDDIMRAVRTTTVRETEATRRVPARWSPGWAVGAAAAVIACLWFALRPAPEPQSLDAAALTFQQSQSIAQNAPAAALSPLSQEMELLERDLRGAVEFVMASVP